MTDLPGEPGDRSAPPRSAGGRSTAPAQARAGFQPTRSLPPRASCEAPDRRGGARAIVWINYATIRLGVAELQLVQIAIQTATADQLVMRALLDDSPFVQHQDPIGTTDRGQAVCDDERGAIVNQGLE